MGKGKWTKLGIIKKGSYGTYMELEKDITLSVSTNEKKRGELLSNEAFVDRQLHKNAISKDDAVLALSKDTETLKYHVLFSGSHVGKIKTKKGSDQRYLELNSDIKVFSDGENVLTKGTGNFQTPTQKAERFIKLGIVSEDEADEYMARAKERQEWLKAEITLVPPDSD